MKKTTPQRFMRVLKSFLYAGLFVFSLGGAIVGYSWIRTESTIGHYRQKTERIALDHAAPEYDPGQIATLPPPVRQYFKFTFRRPHPAMHLSRMTMEGDFRRPRTKGFAPTTAEQTTAIGVPALVFSGTTSIVPGIWARMYDAFSEGQMEMKARIVSTLTVVDERETPALNRTSLRRWLMESPLYPAALLPGGPVRWEPLDDNHARAVVSAGGLETSLVATFGPDGRLERFDAEEDGDLTTPYHGSGEQVLRADYRLVSGTMIPFAFTISRVAQGKTYPFWKGRLTSIEFE